MADWSDPYEPNTVIWQPGDIVLHIADAKHPRMFMAVVGYDPHSGLCVVRYAYPLQHSKQWRGMMQNDIRYLLDPARFNLAAAAAAAKSQLAPPHAKVARA